MTKTYYLILYYVACDNAMCNIYEEIRRPSLLRFSLFETIRYFLNYSINLNENGYELARARSIMHCTHKLCLYINPEVDWYRIPSALSHVYENMSFQFD